MFVFTLSLQCGTEEQKRSNKKATHPGLELLNGAPSSLECSSLSLIETDLHVLDLYFQRLAELLDLDGVFLLGAELISETGGLGWWKKRRVFF